MKINGKGNWKLNTLGGVAIGAFVLVSGMKGGGNSTAASIPVEPVQAASAPAVATACPSTEPLSPLAQSTDYVQANACNTTPVDLAAIRHVTPQYDYLWTEQTCKYVVDRAGTPSAQEGDIEVAQSPSCNHFLMTGKIRLYPHLQIAD